MKLVVANQACVVHIAQTAASSIGMVSFYPIPVPNGYFWNVPVLKRFSKLCLIMEDIQTLSKNPFILNMF